MGLIAKEITLYARDLLVMKTAPSLITDSEENVAALKEDTERNTINFLSTVINVFGSVDAELRYSTSPRIVLETACIRCCTLAVTDVAALEERVSRLERNGFSPVREQTAEKKNVRWTQRWFGVKSFLILGRASPCDYRLLLAIIGITR